LIIELIADGRDLSLTRREADFAVRLVRPMTGGMDIKARRIGTLDYAAYASSVIRFVSPDGYLGSPTKTRCAIYPKLGGFRGW
jgi:hypothetical protein